MRTMSIHADEAFALALKAYVEKVGKSVNRTVQELLAPVLGLATSEGAAENPYLGVCGVLSHEDCASLRGGGRRAAQDRRRVMEMTEPLLVDSNALIALFDGDRAVAERLFGAQRVLVPAIVCGEMSDAALSHDEDGRPISYWFRQPGQRDYCVCYASAFADAMAIALPHGVTVRPCALCAVALDALAFGAEGGKAGGVFWTDGCELPLESKGFSKTSAA